MSNLDGRKAALRSSMRQALAAMSDASRAHGSTEIRDRLKEKDFWKGAESVLLYAPLPGEVDVWPLMEEAVGSGKQVFLPRFEPEAGCYAACQVVKLAEDIVIGRYRIREAASHCPAVALNRLDLALVPGVAFDSHRRRLGRGKGYYDRLLRAVSGTKCGIAFDKQIVAEVPVEAHDILLNCILTPTRWFGL